MGSGWVSSSRSLIDRRGKVQRHLCRCAGSASSGAHSIRWRNAETLSRGDGDLVDAFQDRAGDPRPVSLETLGEVAKQPFGLVGVV